MSENSNAMSVFQIPEFGQVRTVMINDDPWFLATDVCSILELSSASRALDPLDEDEKMVLEDTHLLSGYTCATQTYLRGRKPLIISESGLYTLLLRARSLKSNPERAEKVRRFRRWVTHNILLNTKENSSTSLIDPIRGTTKNCKEYTMPENSNAMSVFQSPEFGQVRTVMINDDPWFLATDVCSILELSNTSQALDPLDEDEKMTLDKENICSTDINTRKHIFGRGRNPLIISESGLYTLLIRVRDIRSNPERSEKVRRFRRWVTHDILPSIRKTGSYSVKEEGRKKGRSRAAEDALADTKFKIPSLKDLESLCLSYGATKEDAAMAVDVLCKDKLGYSVLSYLRQVQKERWEYEAKQQRERQAAIEEMLAREQAAAIEKARQKKQPPSNGIDKYPFDDDCSEFDL